MKRITLSDNVVSAITKMVEGNMGAMNVCMSLIKEGEQIDPQNIMG